MNLADQYNLEAVLPIAQQHDTGVIAKRPLANAAWKEPSQQRGIYTHYASTYRERLLAMGLRPDELGVTGDLDAAWPDLALRFTLSVEGVHTSIVGTTSRRHLEQNLAAVEKGPLPAEVFAHIRDAFAHAQAGSGNSWRGET